MSDEPRYRLRATPEDFVVEEIPSFLPSGQGGHTFVRVEKRLRTTDDVARLLARCAGVPPRDVGYAGRKDREAVATQWFSVPGLAPETALALEAPGLRVLEAVPHPHKLRTGVLRGNRFRLRVTGVCADALDRAPARLDALVRTGMPNRFGAQRFGREGDNALRGRELLAAPGRPVRDRRAARFLLSALQAEVFNDVLARRAPERLLNGDVAVVHASGGLFDVASAEAEQPRADAFEISATGPLFGTRMRGAGGPAGDLEREVLALHGVSEAFAPPRGIRLRGTRRPLRVRPAEASCEVLGPGELALRFELPAGSYASVLVESLLGQPPRSTAPSIGVPSREPARPRSPTT